MNKPVGIAVDSAGNVYIADTNNSRIRKVATDGTISTIAGKGGSGYTAMAAPPPPPCSTFRAASPSPSNGTIYIADTNNHVDPRPHAHLPHHQRRRSTPPAGTARISPGALASVYGTGFGATTVQPDLPLPNTAAGVNVTVNGKAVSHSLSLARTDQFPGALVHAHHRQL